MTHSKTIIASAFTALITPVLIAVPIAGAAQASNGDVKIGSKLVKEVTQNNNSGATAETAPNIGGYPSYERCMSRSYKATDKKLLHDRIEKRADLYVKKLGEYGGVIKEISPAYRQTMLVSMDKSTRDIEALQKSSAKENDVTKLQYNSCHLLFDYQVYYFRAHQVRWMMYADKNLQRDKALLAKLNLERNTTYKNKLKGNSDAYYHSARSMLTNSIAAEKAAADNIANASLVNFKTQMVKPTFGGMDLNANYKSSRVLYASGNVVRKVGSSYGNNRKIDQVSLTMKDANGQPVTTNVKDMLKATFVAKVDDKPTTVQLERQALDKPWQVASVSNGTIKEVKTSSGRTVQVIK